MSWLRILPALFAVLLLQELRPLHEAAAHTDGPVHSCEVCHGLADAKVSVPPVYETLAIAASSDTVQTSPDEPASAETPALCCRGPPSTLNSVFSII